jgi:hypothetical protein
VRDGMIGRAADELRIQLDGPLRVTAPDGVLRARQNLRELGLTFADLNSFAVSSRTDTRTAIRLVIRSQTDDSGHDIMHA